MECYSESNDKFVRKVLFNKHSTFDGSLELSFQADNISELSSYFPRWVGCRWNYVISAKQARTSISDEVTSEADRLVLRTIRSQSDLIITTGKTAEAEQLKASIYAPMLVLTNNSAIDFPGLHSESQHPVLLTIRHGSFSNSKVSCIGPTSGRLSDWLTAQTQKYTSKVYEGGIDTGVSLVNACYVSQICLSVTAADNFNDSINAAQLFLARTSMEFNLIQVLESEGTWFFTFQGNS